MTDAAALGCILALDFTSEDLFCGSSSYQAYSVRNPALPIGAFRFSVLTFIVYCYDWFDCLVKQLHLAQRLENPIGKEAFSTLQISFYIHSRH